MGRCEKCKYFRKLKHNFEQGKGFEDGYACDVLLHMPDTEDGWVQEIKPNDMCEMYTPI